MDEFTNAKQEYDNLRELERGKIINYLKNEKIKVTSQGGRGCPNYTSGEHLKIPYNLSNWKYIDVQINEKKYLISLQSFDKDPNTQNFHILMDRIGIYEYENNSDSTKDAYIKMITTDIELPMNDDKLKQLVDKLKAISC